MASFRILTFGCKVNQCDSQILRETLRGWGLMEALPSTPPTGENSDRRPDLIVINTCTVTAAAAAKFRKALRRAKRENPGAAIVVTGCHASETIGSSGSIPGADIVAQPRDFSALASFLAQAGLMHGAGARMTAGQSYFAEHTRAFLKIQDGCDCFCSYCIVPLVRPKLWSEKPDKVIAAINNLAAKGYKEVVLTGIHLGFYGRESSRDSLLALLERAERECGIERIRLSSIEINEISDELLEFIARSKRLCHHLHVPLQSGDEIILQKMGRKYSRDGFLRRVGEIRRRIPGVGVTTDVIVGFPGEGEEEFQHTCDAVSELEFAKVHVFRYSPRPGTRAATMQPPVPPATSSSRARQLLGIGERASQNYKRRFIGRTLAVLAETCAGNGTSCTGVTSNYIRVRVLGASADRVNTILPARIIKVDEGSGMAIANAIE